MVCAINGLCRLAVLTVLKMSAFFKGTIILYSILLQHNYYAVVKIKLNDHQLYDLFCVKYIQLHFKVVRITDCLFETALTDVI